MLFNLAEETKSTRQAQGGSAASAVPMENVSKWYGAFQVLRDVDLDVTIGERIVV